jgi:prevent-host-death family protein
LTKETKYGTLNEPEDNMALNLRDNVKPISYFKANAAEMMNYVNERRNPIIITQNGEARAVLMDINTYQDNEDAVALLSILKIAEKDIENGNIKDSEEVFRLVRQRLSNKSDELRKKITKNE